MSGYAVLSSIELDRDGVDRAPLYTQVVQSIIDLIERGHLPNGTKIPPIRALATQLGVTRVTIHKAYQELRDKGWVDAAVGRGTYVSHMPVSRGETLLDSDEDGMTPDKAMADISAVRQRQGTISLAIAEPDPRLYPGASFLRLFRSFEDQASELLRYGSYQGDPHLRQMIVGLLANKGIKAHFDDILVTSGVTQGLSLSVAALCEPGDKVLVEEPTYLGFLSLLKSYQLEPLGVPFDEEGPRLDILAQLLLQHNPRVFYTIPNFQNPSGLQVSSARREQLLAMLAEHRVTVIEDDVYGDIRFEDEFISPLRARDEGVVYINSFSKNLFPGLRVGYILPPADLKHPLLTLIRRRALCGPPLLHGVLTEFLRRGGLGEHIARVVPIYRSRRDVLLDALETHMPDGVRWTVPKGGYCTWLTLPAYGVYDDLYPAALAQGVAFTPGRVFFSHGSDASHLRLCFSLQEEHLLDKAIAILGRLIKASLSRSTPLYHLGSTPIV